MKSKMQEAIKLQSHPVAVLKSHEMPNGAIHFKEGVWGWLCHSHAVGCVKGQDCGVLRGNNHLPGR